MMKSILILIISLISIVCFSQQNTPSKYSDPQNMDILVQQEAHYPYGDDALLKLIYDRIKWPPETKGKAIVGEVTLSFDVLADSSLTGFSVLKTVGYGIENAVIDVMKNLKYAPSIQSGVKVRMNVIATIPIRVRNE